MEAKDLHEAVYTALGSASVCWDETPKGVFDAAKATNIGAELIAWVEGNYSPNKERPSYEQSLAIESVLLQEYGRIDKTPQTVKRLFTAVVYPVKIIDPDLSER